MRQSVTGILPGNRTAQVLHLTSTCITLGPGGGTAGMNHSIPHCFVSKQQQQTHLEAFSNPEPCKLRY